MTIIYFAILLSIAATASNLAIASWALVRTLRRRKNMAQVYYLGEMTLTNVDSTQSDATSNPRYRS